MIAGRGIGPDAAGGPARHLPVMLREVLLHLTPRDGGVYLDGTYGAGGYSRAILEAANCKVVAIDRDQSAIVAGAPLVEEFRGRLVLAEDRFSRLDRVARDLGFASVDGVVLDVGVSSMQFDEPARGFSFRADGPLDMRMQRSGRSAADAVNELPEAELARVIAVLGEERRARAVARAIVEARKHSPIRTTGALADIVRSKVHAKPGDIDPATRTFQALRIYVNDELAELAGALIAAERILALGGRLVAVSFHSLEDRLAKTFLAARSRAAAGSRHQPKAEALPATFRVLTKKALTPSTEEVAVNARSRSAKLRAAERTDVAARADDPLAGMIAGLPRIGAATQG
ncbi:MAG TPA: 16S rRNA (cytosine(1402)-N(4))-methyltransferase RsmH [Xanthobacteraceae bacterium]|nr:16S rRNA (cytosine(1402)-N(4))-methyltransferase RsmH [Xanthobacteraceae bacterium]